MSLLFFLFGVSRLKHSYAEWRASGGIFKIPIGKNNDFVKSESFHRQVKIKQRNFLVWLLVSLGPTVGISGWWLANQIQMVASAPKSSLQYSRTVPDPSTVREIPFSGDNGRSKPASATRRQQPLDAERDQKSSYLEENIPLELAQGLDYLLEKSSKEIQMHSASPLQVHPFVESLEAFKETMRDFTPGALRTPAADRPGPIASTLFVVERPTHKNIEVKWKIYLSPEILQEALRLSQTSEAYRFFILLIALKEGAELRDMKKDAHMYVSLWDERELFKKQNYQITDEKSLENAKGYISKLAEAEALGYRMILNYFEATETLSTLNFLCEPNIPEPIRRVAQRFKKLAEVASGKTGSQRELAMKEQILMIDIASSAPELTAAIRMIVSKEGLRFLIENKYFAAKIAESARLKAPLPNLPSQRYPSLSLLGSAA